MRHSPGDWARRGVIRAQKERAVYEPPPKGVNAMPGSALIWVKSAGTGPVGGRPWEVRRHYEEGSGWG
jgi:hypothetical protein